MLQHFQENSFISTVKENNIPEYFTFPILFEKFKDPIKENNDAKNNCLMMMMPKYRILGTLISYISCSVTLPSISIRIMCSIGNIINFTSQPKGRGSFI